MASPQLEHGHTRIADELFEAMIRFEKSKRQYKVLLAVIRKTYGYQKKADVISSGQLAELTGLHSPHCRSAVRELADLGVLHVEPVGQYQHIELVKDYDNWGLPGPGQAEGKPEPGPKQSGTKTVRPRTKTVHTRKKKQRNNHHHLRWW